MSLTQEVGADLPLLSPPTVEVLSNRSIKFIKECIDISERRNIHEVYDLPSRLLDLDRVRAGRVTLALSHDILQRHQIREDIRYATLSYCWGGSESAKFQSKTTVNNLEDVKDGLYIYDLSPVIQDAIQVSTHPFHNGHG